MEPASQSCKYCNYFGPDYCMGDDEAKKCMGPTKWKEYVDGVNDYWAKMNECCPHCGASGYGFKKLYGKVKDNLLKKVRKS